MTHDHTEAWKELESIALTEPDPNQALFNLPQLKAFITRLRINDRKALKEKVEKWLQSSAQLYAFPPRVHYNKALREVIALLSTPE